MSDVGSLPQDSSVPLAMSDANLLRLHAAFGWNPSCQCQQPQRQLLKNNGCQLLLSPPAAFALSIVAILALFGVTAADPSVIALPPGLRACRVVGAFSSARPMNCAFFSPLSSGSSVGRVGGRGASCCRLRRRRCSSKARAAASLATSRVGLHSKSYAASATRLFRDCGGNDPYDNKMLSKDNIFHQKRREASFLTEQLATRLVQGKTSGRPVEPMKACIAVAGGGSAAASAIASTPGASSLLLESIVTYDRVSFAEFVSDNIADDEAWLMKLERGMTEGATTADSSDGGGESGEKFQFSSAEAAVLLSRSSLRRSLRLVPGLRDRSLACVGVGCTSSLVGKVGADGRVVGGRPGRRSRAYVACSTLGGTRVWEVRLDSGAANNPKGGGLEEPTTKSIRRSRSEEESAVSNLILLAMIRHREGKSDEQLDSNGTDESDGILGRILDREGDSIVEKSDVGNVTMKEDVGVKDGASAAEAASRIIEGEANVVAILPVVGRASTSSDESNEEQVQRMEALFSDSNIPFPEDVLIVPGSFNPPHRGHVALANAAAEALQRLRREEASRLSSKPRSRHSSRISSVSSSSSSSSLILDNLWSTVGQHFEQEGRVTVLFEMSVTNADKPPLDPLEAKRRVDSFATLMSPSLEGKVPEDWAVILTNAPLFSQKASVLGDLMMGGDPGGGGSFGSSDGIGTVQRRMSFVLGTDTMARIINPKYYGNSREDMLAALREMNERGVHFIVGGRLEQGTENGSRFVNGEEEAESLPPDVRQMFTLLNEEEFRLDISSTELRKRLACTE